MSTADWLIYIFGGVVALAVFRMPESDVFEWLMTAVISVPIFRLLDRLTGKGDD